MSHSREKEFLSAENLDFVADLYKKYLENPTSVSGSWEGIFREVGDSLGNFLEEEAGPSWKKKASVQPATKKEKPQDKDISKPDALDEGALKDSLGAFMLIRLYRVRGHLAAKLDPLALMQKQEISELHPKTFGFEDGDWDRPIFLGGVLGFEKATLREIMARLHQTYCGSLGVEFMHIIEPAHKQWIQEHIENESPIKEFSTDEQKRLLRHLIHAESFENFLNTKHKGAKRFGLEGCEAVIPLLLETIAHSSNRGVKDVVLGMAHRGRLNVLANVMGKPLEKIFFEFSKGYQYASEVEGSGDVKYHMGYSNVRPIGGRDVILSLTPNPSHLEAVDPVVLGRVRARQDFHQDNTRSQVMGILLHGDAAFPGQGVVSECFGLSDLEGYKTGGTLHVVINNQIGFTTSPHASRSSAYSSDLAKAIGAPIFHVNGDDPEAVIVATRLASEFRQKFQQDVVIDVIGYRRFGHNEADDPSFTQPKMYESISDHLSVRTQYEKHLLDTGSTDKAYVDSVVQERKRSLEEAYAKAQDQTPSKPDWMQGRWADYKVGAAESVISGYTENALKGFLEKLTTPPSSEFSLHKRMGRLLDAKKSMAQKGEGIDWGTAESLAFASILDKGYPIRLSGQDSGRGTFSQRHAIWTDQESETTYVPLNHLRDGQAPIEILNSPLSEFSVLGYEYGYAMSSPETLVLWEAQFGDFANGAQVIMDQFISSGETKWHRLSGVVMLLPHGYEGQGPEHSSARLERYLQLCAEDNMHVAYCSTPASYFHILRRQVLGSFRKPLVLMTPKSLLRHPLAVSSLKGMALKTRFEPVIGESDSAIKEPLRLVICSGKVYYDLLQARVDHMLKDVALVRLEELYPFPEEDLVKVFASHKDAEVIWCQEEPENMGAWHFVDRRLESAMGRANMTHVRPIYVGRKAAASPATGFASVHAQEQESLVYEALGLEKEGST